MVAFKVLWRGTDVLPPLVKIRKRSSSLSRIWRGESALTLDAASSMASGMPSSLSQMRATAGAFSGVRANPGSAAAALSTKRPTDS